MSFQKSTIVGVTYTLTNDVTTDVLSSSVIESKDSSLSGGSPSANGLYNASLGTTENTYKCATCNEDRMKCPGHTGVLYTRYPVRDPVLKKSLLSFYNSICIYCSHFIIDPNTLESSNPIKIIKDINKKNTTANSGKLNCYNCKLPVVRSHYVSRKSFEIKFHYNGENYNYINALGKFVLSRVPESIVNMFTKYKKTQLSDYLRHNIVVPAVATRPEIISKSTINNSATTHILKMAFETISQLNETYTSPTFPMKTISVNDYGNTESRNVEILNLGEYIKINTYKNDIITIMNNIDIFYFALINGAYTSDKLQSNQGKTPDSILTKVSNKTGLIRKNLQGKRVNHMIRSVIIGNIELDITEVGIPLEHATMTEIIEYVTIKNIGRLQKYLDNTIANIPHPAIFSITRKGSTRRIAHIRFDNPRNTEFKSLQVGDLVKRTLINGDYVNINRQPSLIFSSIAGMRVRIDPKSRCISINPSVCNYFNADFDGDNMNCIISQSPRALIESMMISAADQWLISRQKLAPLAGAFQDALIGLFEMSLDSCIISKADARWMILNSDYEYINKEKLVRLNGSGNITGREVISIMLPKLNVNTQSGYYKKAYANKLEYNEKDINIIIKDGELISGALDKSIAGQNVSNSIFHIIANDYGNEYALKVIFNLQQLVCRYFMTDSFTLGLNDILPDTPIQDELTDRVNTYREAATQTFNMYNNNMLTVRPSDVTPGSSGAASLEFYNDLNIDESVIEPVFDQFNVDNPLIKLALSGAKGSFVNLTSMTSIIGQVFLLGKPFAKYVDGRILPYYTRNDPTPESRGFIPNSFSSGLSNDVTPYAFGEGRQALISNALSTSITGYANRIANKNVESIITNSYGGSIIHNQNIIQLLTCEIGFDLTKLEKNKYGFISMNDSDFNEVYDYSKKVKDPKDIAILKDEFEMITNARNKLRKNNINLNKQSILGFDNTEHRMVPFALDRIIENNKQSHPNGNIISIYDHNKIITELLDDVLYVFGNRHTKKRKYVPYYIEESLFYIKAIILDKLCYANVVRLELTHDMVSDIAETIIRKLKNSMTPAGLSIGILASQSMYEPLTQYILNSKHRAGAVGALTKNVVVRTNEITTVKPTEKMSVSNMYIVLHDDTVDKCISFGNKITMISLDSLASKYDILFEKIDTPVESRLFDDDYQVNFKTSKTSSWCIRVSLSDEAMIINNISVSEVAESLSSTYDVVYGDDYIRCYIKIAANNNRIGNFYNTSVFPQKEKLKSRIVRGVSGITGFELREVSLLDDNYEYKTRNVIITYGSNLKSIIDYDEVDTELTYTDSLVDTQQVYGIFTARDRLVKEITETIPDTQKYTNSVIADNMCITGEITPILRKGIQEREPKNVSLQASLQTPIGTIYEAARNNVNENLLGISGPLMFGAFPKVGTNYVKIMIGDTNDLDINQIDNTDDI